MPWRPVPSSRRLTQPRLRTVAVPALPDCDITHAFYTHRDAAEADLSRIVDSKFGYENCWGFMPRVARLKGVEKDLVPVG